MRQHKKCNRKNTAHPTKPIILQITEVSRSGAGIGRADDGRVVFVPFTAAGDKCKVKITKQKNNYAEGELLELIESSPVRISPLCPVFGHCGGCQWQHIPYEQQWQIKNNGVRESMQRARLNLPLHWDEFPAEKIWEYRNRIQLRGFKSEIGF